MSEACVTEYCDLTNTRICGKKANYIAEVDFTKRYRKVIPLCKKCARRESMSYKIFKIKRKWRR